MQYFKSIKKSIQVTIGMKNYNDIKTPRKMIIIFLFSTNIIDFKFTVAPSVFMLSNYNILRF